MQILIMTGPHSQVREITLSARHLVFGGATILALLFGANLMMSSASNQTKDLLHKLEKKELSERRFVIKSDDDYETKLFELQARLADTQRSLEQLDALRAQLLQTNGQGNITNLSNANFNNPVLNFGNAQGGPLHSATATINLGNQGEQYGARLDRTLQDSITLKARVEEVQRTLANGSDTTNSLPTGSPLALMPQPSSGLGYRTDPITQQVAWHDGTDYPAAYGTPILATAEGKVTRAGWDEEYGNIVEIAHKNGITTRYAHAQQLLIKQGDLVKKAQVIATVGSTGRSTGPHVHYEILRNDIKLGRND